MKRSGEIFVSFRASKIVIKQLERLMKAWGENRSQVIIKSVNDAANREGEKKNAG